MEPNEILKQATEKKRAGDFESAIKLLRDAYKKISKGPVAYSVNTFLRLPAYLQEAGKGDEGWRELQNMLTKGYPNQSKDPAIVLVDHSAIYDAMRQFLQREGKDEEAVKFGVLSYMCWGFALHKQTHAKDADRFFVSERRERLQADFSSENIRSTVTKLLKKAGKAELTPKVTSIVEEYVKRLPDINLGQIAGEIDEVIFK